MLRERPDPPRARPTPGAKLTQRLRRLVGARWNVGRVHGSDAIAAVEVTRCRKCGSSEIRVGQVSGGQAHAEPVVDWAAEAAGDAAV